jgi:excisionase family DNA binding protein
MGALSGLELVDARALARSLGVSPYTVLDLARRGKIPSVRVGRQVRFEAEAVRRALGLGGPSSGQKDAG